MDDFGGVLEEDLGDFKFESDAKSLQQILENRAISPTSLGYGKPKPNVTNIGMPTLTPAKNIPASLKKQKDKFEFFEAKNGGVFCRPRVKDTSVEGGSTRKNRGFGREKLKGVLPVRLGKPNSIQPKPCTLADKRSIFSQNNLKNPHIKTRNTSGTKSMDLCKSEKRINPLHFPLPRQSISERKAIPKIDSLNTLIPQPIQANRVRKELNFNEGSQNPVTQHKSASESGMHYNTLKQEESFDFVKPLNVGNEDNRLSNMFGKTKDTKSLAKMIMMRESLAGLPKESIGGLFRQSLSLAELDRLFEDDSTQSFENLETRLKTPMRKIKKVTPSYEAAIKNDDDKINKNHLDVELANKNELKASNKKDTEKTNSISGEEQFEKGSAPLNNYNGTESQSSGISINKEHTMNKSQLEHDENSTNKTLNNNTLVEIYEIEYSDDEAHVENTSINISTLLQRSLSINDLQSASQSDANGTQKNFQLSPKKLHKSFSDTNLNDDIASLQTNVDMKDVAIELIDNLEEENEFLRQAQEDLEKYRQEQVSNTSEIAQIMLLRRISISYSNFNKQYLTLCFILLRRV